jgi:hypothetical protein
MVKQRGIAGITNDMETIKLIAILLVMLVGASGAYYMLWVGFKAGCETQEILNKWGKDLEEQRKKTNFTTETEN